MQLRNPFRRLRPKSLHEGDYEDDGRRSVDNIDAMAASQSRDQSEPQGEAPGAVPPGYIKTYDEGRPPH